MRKKTQKKRTTKRILFPDRAKEAVPYLGLLDPAGVRWVEVPPGFNDQGIEDIVEPEGIEVFFLVLV
jgi:hypothetical protein